MAQWQADVARARWRADLLDYAAAGLRSIGHNQDAEAKEAKARAAREFADACETFETLRESQPDSALCAAARAAFMKLRSDRRAGKGLTGHTSEVRLATVDNFAEPSDDELLGVAS